MHNSLTGDVKAHLRAFDGKISSLQALEWARCIQRVGVEETTFFAPVERQQAPADSCSPLRLTPQKLPHVPNHVCVPRGGLYFTHGPQTLSVSYGGALHTPGLQGWSSGRCWFMRSASCAVQKDLTEFGCSAQAALSWSLSPVPERNELQLWSFRSRHDLSALTFSSFVLLLIFMHFQ